MGERVLGATDYYTAEQIAQEFSEVKKVPAKYAQIPNEVFMSFLPAGKEELLESMLLIQDFGYYGGASLQPSLDVSSSVIC